VRAWIVAPRHAARARQCAVEVEGRLDASARGYSGSTPYARWRDWPVLIVSLLILAAATVAARVRR